MSQYSYSKVSSYMSCPLKYKYQNINKLRPKKKAKPLALGSCMAAGIASFREGNTQDKVLNTFMKTWKDEGSVLDISKIDDPLRSVERGLEILTQYMLEYPDEPADVVMPEVRFDEEIMPGIRWRGRLDGIMKVGNEIALIEDKTASRWGDTYFKPLQNSYQVMSYLYIAKSKGLFDTYGKQRPKLLANIIYIHATDFRWPRRYVDKFNQDVDGAWAEILKWIQQIEHAREINHFPAADYDICDKYGGCEFLPLRFANEDTKDKIIKAEFNVGGSR